MKILLLDADGVTLKKRDYFSDRFCQEYNVPIDEIMPFFKNEFRLCQQGKADVKVELIKYLPKWKWNKSVDEFLEYWLTTDTTADEDVFEEVGKIRTTGVKCYLASDQEKCRAQYLREKLDFNNKLDGCFFSCELGFQKSQPEYFEEVIRLLQVEPTDITYFDDDQKNVAVATAFGMDARLYSSVDDLRNISADMLKPTPISKKY